jgi:hypothetical protein
LTTAIVADLTTGTGRFNMTTGMVGLVAAIAASVGTTAFGFVAQELGPRVTFLAMPLIAGSGAFRRLVSVSARECPSETRARRSLPNSTKSCVEHIGHRKITGGPRNQMRFPATNGAAQQSAVDPRAGGNIE